MRQQSLFFKKGLLLVTLLQTIVFQTSLLSALLPLVVECEMTATAGISFEVWLESKWFLWFKDHFKGK